MLRLIAPKDAPSWFLAVLQQIERAIRDQRLEEVTTTTLPDPERSRGAVVLVTDLGMTAFSDGTAWKRSDTGATI